MEYFNHDTTAGGDDKIIALRLECGGAAVDAYWVILEQIYRDETELDFFGNQHLTRSVCHRLATDEKTLKTWISSMLEIGLLESNEKNGGAVYSERAFSNIQAYKLKVETARQNGKKGGRKPTKKPKENQSQNRKETDAKTDVKANKIKENKDFGLHKVNQKSFTESAATAASAASLSDEKQAAPHCPMCDSLLRFDARKSTWNCYGCNDTFDHERINWR